MLARPVSSLGVSQQPCCSGSGTRVTPYPVQHSRVLVVARTSYSTRSNSPRSESWRSSWRTELDHGSNGNGNGSHSNSNEEYYTAHSNNGNGYYHHEEESQDRPAQAYSWASEDDAVQASVQDGSAEGFTRDDDEAGSSGGGFFTDGFKDALKQALSRSPLYAAEYGGVGSGDEESVEPQPYENEVETMNQPIFTDQFRMALKESMERQQAELDKEGYGSDDEYVATPYVPRPPPRREMSPIEEILSTALGASQLHLRRLTLMKNEIDAAIERETKQIERLGFALTKTEADIAYYKTLEAMVEDRRQR